MRKILTWVGVAMFVAAVSACAHTEDQMQAGTHNMPPNPKINTMSNKAMPEANPNCTPEALASMPPEHRAACGK